MAELLVRAQASTNPMASEIGDIIIVRPDGHIWGKGECLPEYRIRKYPGVLIEDMEYLQQILFQDEIVIRTMPIDKKEWEDDVKKIAFIERVRYVELPAVVETNEVERTIVIPLPDLTKPLPFKYLPEEVSGAPLGYVRLKGVVDVNTVEGRAINTYVLKRRKYSLKQSVWDEILRSNDTVSEVSKDISFVDEIDVSENIPIVETVWKPTV